MTMNKTLLRLLFAAALLLGGIAVAQKPAENVNPNRHPNLAAAQRACDHAYEKIVEAQQANEFDLSGHAAKAKELIEQASQELKQAAQTANKNHQ
jgi:F0F1-type ATP synthase membrane subunit b/b'